MHSRLRRTALVVPALLAATLTLTSVDSTATAGPQPAAGPRHSDWSVTSLGDGRYRVSWTSPRLLPTTSDRPTITGDGLAFGTPTVAPDGRTVTAVVTAGTAPTPGDLDVVLSGDRIDEPGFDPAADGPTTTTPHRVRTDLAAPDPGVAGPFPTVTSDYEWPSIKLPGMKEPIEMVGHVVEPAASAQTGPRPLVLFLHGRHEVCYNPEDPDDYARGWPCKPPFAEIPSHLGYDYIQRLLASQGYATVSIRVNGINAQDYRLPDGGADARAAIVQAHLDRWVDLAAEHQVDLDQVVLVGHSRGGEGVDRASIQIPAGAPYRIAGQVLVAPTDFASHTAPYVPTVTLLPYCDGDVFDLQGQRFTDVARDLVPGDTSLKSSVLVMGANHNFFNTEWTPATSAAPSFDDWGGGDPGDTCSKGSPGRLTGGGQRKVGKAYVAGAVHLFTGDDEYLPMFDGSPVTVPSIGSAQVLTHAVGGGRDTRAPGAGARPTLATGDADARLCNGVEAFDSVSFGVCGRQHDDWVTPDWPASYERVVTKKFLEFSWDSAGSTGGLRLGQPLDLSADRLELRTLVAPGLGDPDLRVRITDGSGGSAVLEPVAGTEAVPLPEMPFATKVWAEAVVVDPTTATGVDLSDIVAVDLVAGSDHGQVWVADVSAAPTALPSPATTRAPQVRISSVKVPEGTGGAKVLKVPFTIVGTVTQPSQFVAFAAGEQRGRTQRLVVDVAPGQTSGTIPIAYVADDVDGPNQPTSISLWPLQGIATDDYLATATVVDDD